MFRDDRAMLLELEQFENQAAPKPVRPSREVKGNSPETPADLRELEVLALMPSGSTSDGLAARGLLPIRTIRRDLSFFGLAGPARRRSGNGR